MVHPVVLGLGLIVLVNMGLNMIVSENNGPQEE